ncbi:MAG: GDP-L-fucose synthase [Thermodesulfovibrionales bacterium]|jgi:GDP-L-fucose synthase
MNKESRIYIAGHRGLVGSAIQRGLQSKGYGNLIARTSRELDLRRQSDVEAFFERERPEYVFLSAAKVGGILANNTYKAEFIYDNLLIASNIINAAYKYGVKKLLNLGSSCIYPKFAPQPMKEDHLLTGILEPTNEPYAVAKIAAIKLCRYYNEQYGTNFMSLMPTNLYGPGDNFHLLDSHVLPALLRKFHIAKLLRDGRLDEIKRDLAAFPSGVSSSADVVEALAGMGVTPDAVRLWGSGEPFREFLYVDDLADACIYLMEKYDYPEIGEFVNVGTGRDIRIKEVAEIVREVVGFVGAIEHDPTKPDGTPRKLLDVSKIRGLGWEAKTEFRKGVSLTYQWYVRQCELLTGTPNPVSCKGSI